MALVNCPECGKSISDQAPRCPHCGYQGTATTIEETAKKWKALQLVGGLGLIPSVVFTMWAVQDVASTNIGIGAMTLCLGLYLYASLMAWWHHG